MQKKKTVLLCKLINAIQPGLVPRVNLARAPFPEMENIAAFLSACRSLGVAEHSLFDTKDLHEKKDLLLVVRCMQVLGASVQTTVPDFNGPYLGVWVSVGVGGCGWVRGLACGW